jgi:hypothetical protein
MGLFEKIKKEKEYKNLEDVILNGSKLHSEDVQNICAKFDKVDDFEVYDDDGYCGFDHRRRIISVKNRFFAIDYYKRWCGDISIPHDHIFFPAQIAEEVKKKIVVETHEKTGWEYV